MTDLLVAQPDGSLLHSKRVGSRSTVLVGRHPKSGIVISNDRISRRHALLFEHESNWYAVDLDSKAGLEAPTGATKVHRFDPEEAWVSLGPVVIWVDGLTSRDSSSKPIPIRRPRKPVLRTRADFVDRELRTAPSESNSLVLACRSTDPDQPDVRLLDLAGSDRVLIGRNHTCDLVIEDDAVPDLGWILYREDGRWTVADLRDAPADGDPRPRRARLQPGHTITAGSVLMTATTVESAIPRSEESSDGDHPDMFDVPDLGSIFDGQPTVSNLEDPKKPGKPRA